jgi:hypothetical protein
MTTEKQFICECGKTFTNGQSFNGHKSNCKIHHEAKYGSTLVLSTKYEKVAKSVSNFYAEIRETHKQSEQAIWQQAKHTCERCGKVMTEKFGSGRFCSKSCANSRDRSEETKRKISKSVSDTSQIKQVKQKNIEIYEENPKYCKICQEKISYDRRFSNTCEARACQIAWAAHQSKGKAGGLRHGAGTGKQGWYKGYYCDSSYELAYVIYNLDHNISFVRNKQAYEYIGLDNKIHKYYLDFIEDNTLVEIKGYWTETVQRKLDAVNDMPIKLLMKKDIQFMIDYVKQTYCCTDITTLYES